MSQKFAELTKEAKRILDAIKAKSESRKLEHGINEKEEQYEKASKHHKTLPREIKEKMLDVAKEVDNLHLSFDKFTLQT